MAKVDYAGSLPTEFGSGEQLGDEVVPDDALPLCAKCLRPCEPLQYYCDNCYCNDAINPLTPYIGFVNIRFNYDIFCTMWRGMWGDEDIFIISKLFYLFLIAVYAPIMLIVGIPVYLIYKIPQRQIRNAIWTILIIALISLLAFYAHSGRP